MDFDYKTMGQRIKLRRKEKKFNQAELAEMLDISPNHLSAIECGTQHLSFELFVSICMKLHINPDYLINGCTHTDNVPFQISDNLNMCDEKAVKLMRKFSELILEFYPNENIQK